jgi:hypothetical protein
MAFKLNPGRGNMEATGRGIPAALMTRSPMRQQNPNTGEDLKKKAQAEADEKLKKNIEAKPLGGSEDVRKETGTATNIRLATTPAEIAKWKASIGKPGAGRYNQTVTAEAKAQGMDKPQTETVKATEKPAETKKKNLYSYGTVDKQFGSYEFNGGVRSENDEQIQVQRRRHSGDTNMENAALGSAFTTGKNNLYNEIEQTDEEARLTKKGILKSDYNPASDVITSNKNSTAYNPNRRSSAEQLKNALKYEPIYDAKIKNLEDKKAAVKAKAQAAADAVKAKKDAAAKAAAERAATLNTKTPAQQRMKSTGKTPPTKQMAKKIPMKQMGKLKKKC